VVREAYVRAFIASTFGGTTNLATQAILESSKSTIASFLQRDPTITGIDLKNFATTISTVERRLGVEANAYIQYFFVCSVCWKRHEPDTLYKLKSSMCTEDGCSGQLYTMKHTKKNAQKRLPCKILPYVKLFPAVQRILLRPGKYEQLQQWRKDGDEPKDVPPMTFEDWKCTWPEDTPMQDIYDGWGWRAVEAGLKC
jgi:hypothetical protein